MTNTKLIEGKRYRVTFNDVDVNDATLALVKQQEAEIAELNGQLFLKTDKVKCQEGWLETANKTIADKDAEIARLKNLVISYGAPWADSYARQNNLPEGYLYEVHFNILKDCGARMDDYKPFIQAAAALGEKE